MWCVGCVCGYVRGAREVCGGVCEGCKGGVWRGM